MAAVFTQVGGDPIGAGRLRQPSCLHRIGLVGAPGLPDGSDMIDVDVQAHEQVVCGFRDRLSSPLAFCPENSVSQRFLSLVVAALVVACGTATTSTAQSVTPQAGSETAVQGFLRAVADSNLDKMAQLWGTSKGPAASTHQPSDYERRLVIMQAYLRGANFRIISNTADGSSKDRRVLQVEMTRNGCDEIVPFTAARAGTGWVVTAIDLDALGSPGRRCSESDSTSGR
jgi:hypothetical protein